MFYAVDFKNDELGVLDSSDNVVEYYSLDDIKKIVKSGISICGVKLAEDINPIYTLNGLSINLAYRRHKKFGKWIVVVLREGDRFGCTLKECIHKDTVAFYDTSSNFAKQEYPLGQYVCSYYLDTISHHVGVLKLNLEVPAWTVDSNTMKSITTWLKSFNS